MQNGNVVICAVGLKGAIFVAGLLARNIRPDQIISYDQKDDRSCSFTRLAEIATCSGINFLEQKHPVLLKQDLVYIVGWQYLMKDLSPFAVVFHDSLLPRYRGFAPTVAALINGEPKIGVTALSPNETVDGGPIIAQASIPIAYPIKIAGALALQAGLMIDLAVNIHGQWSHGVLPKCEQDRSRATYSLWRDDADYEIEWSRPAEEIARFIDAVGHPYAGARTTVQREPIIVENGTALHDLHFDQRHIGKVWRLDNGRPVVVCGTGLLRVDNACRLDGSLYEFRQLRVRMGYRVDGSR